VQELPYIPSPPVISHSVHRSVARDSSVVTSISNKCFGLVDIGQRKLDEYIYITLGGMEDSSAIAPTIRVIRHPLFDKSSFKGSI
jgi:hypothetical protein